MNYSLLDSGSGDADPCPWGDGCIVLTGHQLSVAEKSWLGRQIVSKRSTPLMLAMRYGLQRKVLCKYGLYVKNGRRLCSAQGKPRSLDDIAERKVQTQLSQNANITTRGFNQFINEGCRDTVVRRNNAALGTILSPVLSKSTLKRYRRRLRMRQ